MPTRIELRGHAFGGSLWRPQEPTTGNGLLFRAEGERRRQGWRWEGDFAYGYQTDEGQRWNLTARGPDAQPYIWADDTTGRWNRQYFAGAARVHTDGPGRWQWGGTLDFTGGQGDRRNNPRPLYRYRYVRLTPQTVVRWERYQATFSVYYEHHAEDNEAGFFATDDPLIYRLRGIGTFSRSPFVSGERQLREAGVGGSVAVGRPNRWWVVARGGSRRGYVEEGLAILTNGGRWRRWQASFDAQRCLRTSRQHLGAEGDYRITIGVDPEIGAVNARLAQAQAAGTLHWLHNDTVRFAWRGRLRAGGEYRQQEDLAASTTARLLAWPVWAAWGGLLRPQAPVAFGAAVCGGARLVTTRQLSVGGPTLITEALARPDFQVLTTSTVRLRVAAGVDWRYGAGRVQLWAMAERTLAVGDMGLPAGTFRQNFTLTASFVPAVRYARLPQSLLL